MTRNTALPLLVLLVCVGCVNASLENVKSGFQKSIDHHKEMLKIGKEALDERAKKLAEMKLTTMKTKQDFSLPQEKKQHHEKSTEVANHHGRNLQTGFEWVRTISYAQLNCEGEPQFFNAVMLNVCQKGLMIGGNMASKKVVAKHPSTVGGDFYFEEHWYFGQTCSGDIQAVNDLAADFGLPSNFKFNEGCQFFTELQYISANEDVMPPPFEGMYQFEGTNGCIQDNNLVTSVFGYPFDTCIFGSFRYTSEGCPGGFKYEAFSDSLCMAAPTVSLTIPAQLCRLDLEDMETEIDQNGADIFHYRRMGCWPPAV